MKKYIKFTIFFFLFIVIQSNVEAQRKYDVYWVGFEDKKDSPYSLFSPQEYLSARALERREKQGLFIDSLDLPVNPRYVKLVKDKGFRIHLESKWLNGVLIIIKEGGATNPKELLDLAFVKEVFAVGFSRKVLPVPALGERDYKTNYKKRKSIYGLGKNQIEMLHGHYLHQMGYQGQGMQVAIFDGGFDGILETPAFDSLFQNNQILGTRDFVEGDDYVFESSTHGRNVLSTMASNMPHLFVGTAPYAEYYLFKTEDHPLGEYIAEEYYWAVAAEYADKIGVDVINSSLGYHTFDDNQMNYAYVDLDGKTSAMTRAATIAGQKGILIVSSAGNEGKKKWKHITVPNDAENILTVGAVDRDGFSANFSSFGFEDKAIIKPNVVARGAIAVVASKKRYSTTFSSGTSFSAPIMAGMVTSFWQALPHLSNMDIIYSLQNNGSNSLNPDNALGYGIPNFLKAYTEHSNSIVELKKDQQYYKHIADLDQHFDLFIQKVEGVDIHCKLQNALGQVVYQKHEKILDAESKKLWHFAIPIWETLPNAVYTLEIKIEGNTKRILLTK